MIPTETGVSEPDLNALLLQACQAGVVPLSAALGKIAECDVPLSVKEPIPISAKDREQWSEQAAILLLLVLPSTNAMLIIPENETWSLDRIGTQSEKWQPLLDAATALLPEEMQPRRMDIVRTSDLSDSLTKAGLLHGARFTAFADGDEPPVAKLVWPLANVEALLVRGEQESGGSQRQLPTYHTLGDGLKLLPPYGRSLLKIPVPVTVTLAQTKRPIQSLLELGPGAIIQFKKACDEPLSLEVNGEKVAEGEAVKVGDKFGLWLTSIALPRERFRELSRGS